ncbi:MAG: hypothetical protein JRN45_00485 [Nitrososphaerota archaeon]|nr:hypothetical protein [Nitrososphaerota archaeon]
MIPEPLSKVRFFNAALLDGHVVSRPVYKPAQAFIGSLVHEMERLEPEFAWVQFVFRQARHNAHHTSVTHSLKRWGEWASTPETKVGLLDGEERTEERKEKRSPLYTMLPSLIKKAEEVGGSPTFVMAIQGMVVGGDPGFTSFSHCSDEIDRLTIFTYRDPRVLRWLVRRKFVYDVSSHFATAYQVARYEPPSLVFLTDDLPFYIHLPTGKASLESLAPSEPVEPEFTEAKEDQSQEEGFRVAASAIPRAAAGGGDGVSLARMDGVTVLAEPLDEEGASRLRQLVNDHRRSFEFVHRGGATWFAISSDDPQDLKVYEKQLLSLYGGLRFINITDPVPAYIHELASSLAGPEPIHESQQTDISH